MLNDEAVQRVEAMARYADLGSGFSISTMDMEIRGAGDLLGAKQSGNVGAVGLEMYCQLLAEAVSELRGEPLADDPEPELTFEHPGLIPETYIPDVGQRLHYYKRLSAARSEEEVESTAAELIDRYGKIPEETEELLKVMEAKALCRALRILGLESTSNRLVVHLGYNSLVDPQKVVAIVREEKGRVQLTEDLKIKVRFTKEQCGKAETVIRFLHRLGAYGNKRAIS
jgi:transcription-repair coupling factor (superfamily II helicase)